VSRDRHDSANLEPAQLLRFLRNHIDPVDSGASWPLAHESDEPLDRLSLTLEHGLHAAVGQVPHPPGGAHRERAAAGGLAEEDALDVTLDDDAAALHAP
jgi:hypothetical protein